VKKKGLFLRGPGPRSHTHPSWSGAHNAEEGVTFAKVLRAREDKPKSARADFRYDLTRACESGAFRQAFARARGEVPGTFSKTLCTGVAVK
jgi:hypothetical protein